MSKRNVKLSLSKGDDPIFYFLAWSERAENQKEDGIWVEGLRVCMYEDYYQSDYDNEQYYDYDQKKWRLRCRNWRNWTNSSTIRVGIRRRRSQKRERWLPFAFQWKKVWVYGKIFEFTIGKLEECK